MPAQDSLESGPAKAGHLVAAAVRAGDLIHAAQHMGSVRLRQCSACSRSGLGGSQWRFFAVDQTSGTKRGAPLGIVKDSGLTALPVPRVSAETF